MVSVRPSVCLSVSISCAAAAGSSALRRRASVRFDPSIRGPKYIRQTYFDRGCDYVEGGRVAVEGVTDTETARGHRRLYPIHRRPPHVRALVHVLDTVGHVTNGDQ